MKPESEGPKKAQGLRHGLRVGAACPERDRRDESSLRAFLEVLAAHADRETAHAEYRVHASEDALALELGIARLKADQLLASKSSLPVQIVLLGPTQAGKSSLANAVLDADVAEVSPLAGFTVHPHGFCWGAGGASALEAYDAFFQPLRRVEPADLPGKGYDCFLIADVTARGISPPLAAGCLWDTPDFDSVGADVYRDHVLMTAALADIALLVLSKDKYSDQSVWNLVSLLEPLGLPSLIILNKVDPAARAPLLDSLAENWRAARSDRLPPIVTLPFAETGSLSPDVEGVGELRRLIRGAVDGTARHQRNAHTKALIVAHWPRWLTPARIELQAQAEWDQAIVSELDEILRCYERDYLNHPHHYETFQRALARLLTLLELPGLAGAIASARRILTWPFRRATAFGRRHTDSDPGHDPNSSEQAALRELLDHLLLQLQQRAWSKRDDHSAATLWWHDLSALLRSVRPEYDECARSALAGYTASFQQEIDLTARSLYQRLEDKPVVLNSLRATRITTDAAALAIALHSGGIGIQDFVIAPATLSLTSMLAESALGRYVSRAAEDLKARQLKAVDSLLRNTIGGWLSALPLRFDERRHLKLSDHDIERAESELARYG